MLERREPAATSVTGQVDGAADLRQARCDAASDGDDADVHGARSEFEHGCGASRLAPALDGRPWIHLELHMPAIVDVVLVPGDVRVAEQHHVGSREPAAEPCSATGRRAAVVHHRDHVSADSDLDPLRQRDAVVVVTEYCVHGRNGGERIEYILVKEVASVEYGADVAQQIGVA